jgi:hypothetical protein
MPTDFDKVTFRFVFFFDILDFTYSNLHFRSLHFILLPPKQTNVLPVRDIVTCSYRCCVERWCVVEQLVFLRSVERRNEIAIVLGLSQRIHISTDAQVYYFPHVDRCLISHVERFPAGLLRLRVFLYVQ